MARRWIRWVAVLGGGAAAALCVGLLHLKVEKANLEPTALLKLFSFLLLGLGFALPWHVVNQCPPPTALIGRHCHHVLAMAVISSALRAWAGPERDRCCGRPPARPTPLSGPD